MSGWGQSTWLSTYHNPCAPGFVVPSLRGLICGPNFALFPWLMWSHKPHPHPQAVAVAISSLLMSSRHRGVKPLALSHTAVRKQCWNSVLKGMLTVTVLILIL